MILVLVTDPVTVAGVNSDAVATVLGVGGVLIYWVLEANAGYTVGQRLP